MDIQQQLNDLALLHSDKDLYDEFISDLQQITLDPIYVIFKLKSKKEILYNGTVTHKSQYISSRSYNLVDQLIEKYPYLGQFPNWKNLFNQIGNTSTSIYGLENKDLKWLKKKNRDFLQEKRMK